jgi:mannose/fructose/N-acetylgalactosamine-specific phosphotransferase system component IIC
MVKRTIGYASLILGSIAILVSSLMLVVTVILPFLAETFVQERGITAVAIMDVGGVSLGYYGYTIGLFIIMLSLGVLAASLGRYVVESIEDY